jgi:hypothetical protein
MAAGRKRGEIKKNSVRVVTCVHATPAMTAGGKRGEIEKAPEVPTHRRCT